MNWDALHIDILRGEADEADLVALICTVKRVSELAGELEDFGARCLEVGRQPERDPDDRDDWNAQGKRWNDCAKRIREALAGTDGGEVRNATD